MTTRLLLEGPDLGELVAHVREQFGHRARIVRAERVRTGGFAGFFAKETFEMTVDVPDEPERSTQAFAHHPTLRRGATGMDDLLEAADAADSAAGALTAPPVSSRGDVSTSSQEFAAVLDQVRTLVGLPAPDVVVPAPRQAPPTGAVAARAAEAAPGSARLRAELVRLGVPTSLLDPEPVTLAAVLGRLPQPPTAPRGTGQVLAVVGEGDGPRVVARTLAVRWRLPDASVLDVDPSAGVPPLVRGDGPPRVVTVTVGTDPHDRAQAARVLAALGPDQVWAVLDARTKPADAAAWVAALGAERPVDALAVHGLLDTRAPGTVLEIGLPVAWVDGVPASRLVWAAALGQELDAALV